MLLGDIQELAARLFTQRPKPFTKHYKEKGNNVGETSLFRHILKQNQQDGELNR